MAGSLTPPPNAPVEEVAQPPQDDGGFIDTLARTDPAKGFHDGRGRDAGDRISVYRNNVVVSLADAIANTFAATGRMVGEDFMKAAAIAFAKANKPRSPLMFLYGDTFADFLARLPGLADYPQVPEVARIEYARVASYHAKDAAPLAGET
ncbi:MAG: DNA-binding domain-containing protein, partial [Pseudomonadota bacterium]